METTNLPKTYNPKQIEDKIYKLWETLNFFNPDKLPKKNKTPYTIVIPPPNITGTLHMGHALNTVIQDILIRKKRMEGFKTLWVPGTDHAGIATQNVVEKELKKQGKTRFDLGRKKFIEKIWEWKKKYGEIILNQIKKLGASCDWSRTRFTMDKDYTLAVKEAFSHYYKKGMIYRGKRIINWCPRCMTSLSDLELEYKEEKGKLWYINYPFADKSSNNSHQKGVIVATTRPETMLGDTAVAVNPKDKRYQKIISKKVLLPLTNREIPIIADELVDMEFGTGAVKITPAHDFTDSIIGKKHNLEIIQVIDERGTITEQAPKVYQGLKVLEARKKIIADLKNKGFLVKEEDYVHKVPKCYRCGTTIEILPSWQWFLKMEKLKNFAERPVKTGKIKFYPKKFEKPYFDWLKNVNDWCISRQIWWGHQIPIWECQAKERKDNKSQEKKFFLSLEKPKKCPLCGKCKPKQIEDVLDTWFSSALWPFAVLGWPKKTKDLKKFYPTSFLTTARDILNLWVSRMIFSSIEFTKKIPFKIVYVHPTILTREGKRMSKSLGTGIDPMELIKEYGADATRFGIIYQVSKNQDMKFVVDNIVMGKKFCNKIWNAARFILLRKPKPVETNFKELSRMKNLTLADKRILNSLKKTTKIVNKHLENLEFGKAGHTLYDFFWHQFCDKYIEESKKQNDRKTEKILIYVLSTSLKLLHPFIPFITEEIYQRLPLKKKKKALIIEDWPNL